MKLFTTLVSCLAGCALIATAAHVIIMTTGGYSNAHAPLAIAIAAGVAIGSIAIGIAWKDRRFAVATAIAFCLVAGEAYTMIATAERVVVSREAAAEPARLIAVQRAAAQKRLDEAKAAIPGDTSARITAAQASIDRAETAVATEASKKGCASNCRALLNKAVDDAKSEMAAARAALVEGKKSAQRGIADAEAALAKVPAPKSETPLADKLGLEGWTLDLLAAGLASLAANGLGAALLAFGAHSHREPSTKAAEVETVQVTLEPAPAATPPPVRTSQAKRKAKEPLMIEARDALKEADRFARESFRPAKAGRVAFSDIRASYHAWCDEQGMPPLSDREIGSSLNDLFAKVGLSRDAGGMVGIELARPLSSAA